MFEVKLTVKCHTKDAVKKVITFLLMAKEEERDLKDISEWVLEWVHNNV